jgi:heat shock protein HslJ
MTSALARFDSLCLPLALTLIACGTPGPEQSVAPTTVHPAPLSEELADATYAGILDEPVTLADGVWEGTPDTAGSATRPRVELVEGFRLTGNLDGQDGDEAVVLLRAATDDTGNTSFIAVMGWHRETLRNIANVDLGDGVQLRSARIEGPTIVAAVVRVGPDDLTCCPSQMARLAWTLEGDRLLPTAAEITGRLSVADLGGTEWVLARFDRNAPAPADPEITLAFSDGRFVGSGGCDRYAADVTESSPGQIAVGPVSATRMVCGPPADDLQQRYLRALESARRYSFVAGTLAFAYEQDGAPGTLRYTPRKPGS